MNYNFVAIEGNIGSGKTSLVNRLAEDFNGRAILEQFEDNPFLPSFYKDKSRYAFHVELTFLADRYRQLSRELAHHDLFRPVTFSDYIIDKSLLFARINLNGDELSLYQNLFGIIHGNLPRPDLLIYLYLTPQRLAENIKKRGREYELDIPVAYLSSIHEAYFSFLRQLTQHRILILDANNLY